MRKILTIVSISVIAYVLTYFSGHYIIKHSTPYEKQLAERIEEADMGAADGIDINKATQTDFMKVFGVGEKTASKIIKYRKEIGGFRGMADLLGVEGVGEKRLNEIRKNFKIEKEETQNGNN